MAFSFNGSGEKVEKGLGSGPPTCATSSIGTIHIYVVDGVAPLTLSGLASEKERVALAAWIKPSSETCVLWFVVQSLTLGSNLICLCKTNTRNA